MAWQAKEEFFSGDEFPNYTEMLAHQAGFKAGHNAKKGEFTEEDMEAAYNAGHGKDNLIEEDNFENFMLKLQKLSLPQSLTIENGNITKTEW